MANREGCRSLYEAWQNHNPQISQMHTDTSDTCLPSSFIHENLRHLWIDRISKAMALHRHPSSGRRPLCRTDICGQKRASVGLPPRPVPEINPTRRIKNEANRSEHRTNPIRRTSKNSARNGTLSSPSLNPHLPRARAWHGPWHSGPHRFAANPILVTGCRKPLLPASSITYGSEPLSPHRCNPSATTEPQSRPACQVVPRHFAKTAGRGADSQVAQIHTSSSGACPPSSFICENLRSPWIDRCSIHHA